MLWSLLRRLWKRPEVHDITHTLVCGASRSGKSEAELSRLVSLACRGDLAIVLMDPPGTLASKFLLHLHARGLDGRAIYDRLADTDRVPGYEWLTASTNPDPLQCEAENDERIREFASILLRRRSIQDPAKTPLIEEGLLAALRLYVSQDAPTPLPWLADVFDLQSEARAHLLAHSRHPDLVRKFHEYAVLSAHAARTEVGPAERILRAVLTSPAFRVRSGGTTVDLGQFLDEKGILILDGSSTGNLSRDAASVMMGAVLLRVLAHCRDGTESRVVLVLDEAVNGDLLGLHESRALAEAAKWQLECHILIQDPFSLPSEEIRRNVLQNCGRHEWFRQGNPEAARLAAEDIAIPLLDPLKVHHTEYRIRTAGEGYDRVHTTGKSEWTDPSGHSGQGTYGQTVLWPRRKEVKDAQHRYTALQDQLLLMQKELMLLKPGYRFVRAAKVTPTPEYVPRLQDRWTTGAGNDQTPFRCVLEAMKRRPAFRSPEHPRTTPTSAAVHAGAARTLSERAHRDRAR